MRYQLGDVVPLACLTKNGSGTPALPDDSPVARIYSDNAPVATLSLPIADRYQRPGFFELPLLLDARFAVGRCSVVYQWAIGGVKGGDIDYFEVVAGGDQDGAGLALYYFERPTSSFVLLQTDAGRIVRRRNPQL